MRHFVTFLMMASAMMLMPQKMMAKQVTLHFFVPEGWEQVGVWAYKDASTHYCTAGTWPGDKRTVRTTDYKVRLIDWTGEIPDDELDNALVIFNNGVENTKTQTDKNGFRLIDGAYYDFNGLTDTGFELVASYGGKEVVVQMFASRQRDGGKYYTDAYTAGFKDELLPGKAGDKVKVYVRGRNQKNLQFRPGVDGSTFGGNLVNANTYNSSLQFYGTETCMDFDQAAKSSNTFVITKGSGVSYTVALYNDVNSRERIITGKNISYRSAQRSLSLYINKSIIDTYVGKYGNGYHTGTTKNSVEDYYLIGNWQDGLSYKTDEAEANKMVKQVFQNPIDKNQVDSVVYSKVVKKADTGFGNLYLSFAPASLMNDNSNGWGTSNVYSAGERYNFIARAEVADQMDATAQEGAVLISGYNTANDAVKVCNGQQAINPLVTEAEEDKYNYYIIRFNATTSTYRIEFVDSPYLTFGKDGIRTFCSQMNLSIPDGYKAYVAHAYRKMDDTRTSKGLHGDVEMRRLKYIPANEGVVIVADQTSAGITQVQFPVITDADENSPVTDVEEEWWYREEVYRNSNDTYHNYLVASLFGTTVESGRYTVDENNRYTYATRHFALNKFFNTKTYKSNPSNYTDDDNYIGFFRLAGKVPAGYAYLSLPSDVMDFNGQLLGDFDSNRDDADADKKVNAKMLMSFDDFSDDNSITAIENIKKNSKQDDGAYYTLQGLRVAKPVKGIYIHNGKKIVIK